ncbi:MAG: hypothetical protein RL230_982 [Pseudomonadota bacterium]
MLPELKFLSKYLGVSGAKIFLGTLFVGCAVLLIGIVWAVNSLIELQ